MLLRTGFKAKYVSRIGVVITTHRLSLVGYGRAGLKSNSTGVVTDKFVARREFFLWKNEQHL